MQTELVLKTLAALPLAISSTSEARLLPGPLTPTYGRVIDL